MAMVTLQIRGGERDTLMRRPRSVITIALLRAFCRSAESSGKRDSFSRSVKRPQ